MTIAVEQKLWARVRFYLIFLKIVPFIKMVSVCNNLSFENVDENSDIDLFIVARNGRLFIVRSFVTLILHVLGVRRHDNKIAGRFCLSFFVDESASCLKPIAIENDVYLALWVRYMVPIIDSVADDGGNFSDGFLSSNSWIKHYFDESENFGFSSDEVLSFDVFSSFFRGFFSLIFMGPAGDIFEFLLRRWQMRRAAAKASCASDSSNLIVSDHVLKFHNFDRRREYGLRWISKFGLIEKISREKFLQL